MHSSSVFMSDGWVNVGAPSDPSRSPSTGQATLVASGRVWGGSGVLVGTHVRLSKLTYVSTGQAGMTAPVPEGPVPNIAASGVPPGVCSLAPGAVPAGAVGEPDAEAACAETMSPTASAGNRSTARLFISADSFRHVRPAARTPASCDVTTCCEVPPNWAARDSSGHLGGLRTGFRVRGRPERK